jgi:hypothetical protein
MRPHCIWNTIGCVARHQTLNTDSSNGKQDKIIERILRKINEYVQNKLTVLALFLADMALTSVTRSTHWFELAGREPQDLVTLPENVYNMNETGVMLSMLT